MKGGWCLLLVHCDWFIWRIYVQRHTPQKGISLILDTVSRMGGEATRLDTSQLGEVTNAMSHVNTHLFSQPPRNTMSTHHDHRRGPTTRIEERQQRLMNIHGAHHQDRRTASGAHHQDRVSTRAHHQDR